MNIIAKCHSYTATTTTIVKWEVKEEGNHLNNVEANATTATLSKHTASWARLRLPVPLLLLLQSPVAACEGVKVQLNEATENEATFKTRHGRAEGDVPCGFLSWPNCADQKQNDFNSVLCVILIVCISACVYVWKLACLFTAFVLFRTDRSPAAHSRT